MRRHTLLLWASAKSNWRAFVRYAISGGITLLTYLAILLGLIEVLGTASGIAAGVALLIGGAVNYVLTRSFAFRSDAPHATTMPKYTAVLLANAAGNALVTWLAADQAGIPYPIVQVVYLTVATIAVFFVMKHKVMTSRSDDSRTSSRSLEIL